MLKLVLLITIVERKNSEKIINFFNENNVPLTLGRYGKGTATDNMLNYLGLDEKEKCITFSIISCNILENISTKLKYVTPTAYSFVIPISSIGGKSVMEQFNSNLPEIETNEQQSKNLKFSKELILIIINRGYVDLVMEIAREAGAPGGTAIHARGTGNDTAEKFFGVTIGAEKEMIFIVSEREKRDNIMKTIMDKAGNNTPSGAILFSLPVNEL